jgi:hypothetical protein
MQRTQLTPAFLALLAPLVALELSGCSSAPSDEALATVAAADAYTVENGDRFVVGMQGDRLVLRKSVEGARFPFSAEEIRGKVMVIHPIHGEGKEGLEGGLCARATEVTEGERVFTIATSPLTLDEMEQVEEDDIIRIYLDRDLPRVDAETAAGLGLQLLPWNRPDLRIQGWGGLLSGELGFGLSAPIDPDSGLGTSISIKRENTHFSLTPEARAGWVRRRGFELGFRANVDFTTSLSMTGSLSRRGTIFETPKLRSPRIVVVVFVGFLPVPVTLGVNGNISCSASAKAEVSGALDFHFRARVGGSSFIYPRAGAAPSDWLSQGAWPYESTVDAGVTPRDFRLVGSVGVSCNVPRIELETLIAGLTGPYVTLVPSLGVETTDGEALKVNRSLKLGAGLKVSALGFREAAADVTLLSWSP